MTSAHTTPEGPAAPGAGGSRDTPRRRRGGSAATYEFRTVTLDRAMSRADARRLLTDEAEYGRWELARTRLYIGGARVVTLRRKIIRVASTLDIF